MTTGLATRCVGCEHQTPDGCAASTCLHHRQHALEQFACPRCGNSDIDTLELELGEGARWLSVYCTACGTEYTVR